MAALYFLDEIGDMSMDLQVKLLRVLQEREIDPVGCQHGIPIDVRVIAATHKNIETLIQQGDFREDLYYRLNVMPMEIVALRERREDIATLVQPFCRAVCAG
jgi:transcriptional regulator with PAS, ATPase and Fis domain